MEGSNFYLISNNDNTNNDNTTNNNASDNGSDDDNDNDNNNDNDNDNLKCIYILCPKRLLFEVILGPIVTLI